MNLREKINNMLDSLQKQMEENYHLENPEAVYNLTLNKKKEIQRLLIKLLPYSKHSEKIRKMRCGWRFAHF